MKPEPSEKVAVIFQVTKRIRNYPFRNAFEMGCTDSLCSELSAPQTHLALLVRQHEPMALKDISDALEVSPPSVSTMVDKLVEKGVLQRDPDPNDRRKVVIRIHADAREAMENLESKLQAAFLSLSERLGQEAIDQWYEAMLKIETLMDQEAL